MRERKEFIKLRRLLTCFTLAVVLCSTIFVQPAFAVVSVSELGPYSIGYGVDDMATGNFNNDVYPDIIVTTRSSKFIGILKSDGSGGFAAISIISSGTYSARKIATGDFNEDGKLDFAVTLDSSNNVLIFYGNGDGSFGATPTTITLTGSNALGIAAGDFNNDEHTDLVFGDAETIGGHAHFRMLTNNGSGGFTASGEMPNGGAVYPFKIITKDFNKDGNTDIAFLGDYSGYNFSGNFSMVYGDGSGGFSDGWFQALTSGATNDMDTGDMNNDGLLDIVFSKSHSSGTTFISVLTNPGSKAAFALREFNSSSVYVDNYGGAAKDFNGDYELDAIAAGENKVKFWFGISDYVFSENPDDYISAANNPKLLTAADFNADGKVDLATVNSTNNTISIYLNNYNFGPVVDAISDTKNGTEDGADINMNASEMHTGYFDPEGDLFKSIKITKVPVGGTLKLGAADITAGQEILEADLGGDFVYNPNDNWHGDANIEWRPIDALGKLGIIRRANISIASVIDAPINTAPLTATVNEDTTLTFSTTGSNAIQISDPDVEAAELMQVSLTAANGTLTLNGTTDLSIISPADGSGDSSMTFTGTIANINTALNGLSFNPAADYNGTASITINTNDQGNAGAGSTLSDEDTVNITVDFVNDAPSFTKGSDVTVNEDCGAQTVTGWATGISKGPANEDGQGTIFIVTDNSNPGLFCAGPTIDTYYGNLSFTPAANANGSASITIVIVDDNGDANGGRNMSDPQTFSITVNAINDAPVNTVPVAQTVNEDTPLVLSGVNVIQISDTDVEAAASMGVSLTATEGTLTLSNTSGLSFTAGDGSEDLTLGFTGTIAKINAALDGLSYSPAANFNGSASVSITTNDQGNTGAGGSLEDVDTVNITVNTVNDAPSFTKGANQVVSEDCGVQTVAGWATGMSVGPSNEASQTLAFTATNNNNSLFSVQPAVAANGTLTYTPTVNAKGSTTVTLALSDNGGTANGGVDASVSQTFTITVNSTNDAPTLDTISNNTISEGAGQQAVSLAGISSGAEDEAQTLTVTEVSSDTAIIPDPAVSYTSANLTGTLTYTPAADAFGDVIITVTVTDDGGTDLGGINTFTRTFTVAVSGINDIPTFTKGADQAVNEDCGAQTVTGWATGISAGNASEASQTLTFTVTDNNNSSLFSAQPAVAANGTLTYTPADNANGSATVKLKLSDTGGTDNGGVDTSAVQTFIITVNSVNDAPTLDTISNNTISEGAGQQAVSLAGISSGAEDEAQTLTVTVVSSDTAIIPDPEVSYTSANSTGTLAFTPASDAFGDVIITVTVTDDGGTDLGGINTFTRTFTVEVSGVNNVPSFTKGADQTVNEDCGAQTVTGWATGISAGNAKESSQTLTFTVNNDNSSLFSAQPAVAANGILTYTPAENAKGSATVTLVLSDNGGTANGGVDASASQNFSITVNSANDAPSFTKGADETVNAGSGAQTVTGWATDMSAGPSDESSQVLTFIVNNNNNSLFSVQPAIATDGTLTYTVANNTSGIATVTVTLKDDGGNDGVGTDTSAAQTFTIKVCAQSGSGEIVLSQDTFAAGNTSSTITFTYTAADGGMGHGKLTIEVPSGWSSPSNMSTAVGYTTASTGTIDISGRTITISDINIGSGDKIDITYGDKSGGGPGATASTLKGSYEWTVKSATTADSTLNDLDSSPNIRINPAKVSATQSSIAVDKDNIPADGETTATVTVILTDAYGNTVNGHTVSLSQGSGRSTISPPSIASDSNGKAVFTVSSFSAGTVTYTAKDTTDDITLSETADATFEPGVKFISTAVNVEEGESAEYTVSLVSCPEAEVTVTAEVYGELDVSPVRLVFDADNWNTEQIVTVTAADNSSKDGDRFQTVTNSVYSSDSLYNGLDFDITVNIADNDTPGVSIVQSGGSTEVEEDGSNDSYTVKLFTKPQDDVTVYVNTDNQLTVEPMEITFSSDDWDTAQELIVTAVDDDLIEGPHWATISHTISSSDNDYDDINISEITVGISDNDFSDNASLEGLVVSQGTLTPAFDSGTYEYTVNVNNGVDSITITPTAAESHGLITVNGTVVAGGTASSSITLPVGKNTIEVKVIAQDNVNTEIYLIDVIRAAKHSDDNDDSGSNSTGGGTAPNPPAPQSPASTPAGNSGVTTVELNIPRVEGAKAYEPTLPASFLTSGDATKAVEINTDIAAVTVPGNMLTAANAAGAQNVSLTIAAVDRTKLDAAVQAQIGNRPIIELNLKIDGQKASWSNESAPVTVSLAYTPTAEELKDPEHITVWYIDGSGNAISVPSGRYDPATGKVTFTTTHFSKYAVAFVQKTFSDISDYSWAKNQIEVLASKGIIDSATDNTFSPANHITRADYLVMLVRTLGLSADFTGNFDDIKSEDYCYKEISIARKLGITSGVGNNKFTPDATISRQDIMVLTARALEKFKKLEAAGSGEAINPCAKTTRAEAAVFLYRIYNKY